MPAEPVSCRQCNTGKSFADKLHASGWSWGYCSAVTRDAWRCWSGCGSGLSGEGRLRRPTIQGNFHKSMIDSAASAAVYARTGTGVALHQAETKPYKTLTL